MCIHDLTRLITTVVSYTLGLLQHFYIPHAFHNVGQLFIFYFVLELDVINFKATEILSLEFHC